MASVALPLVAVRSGYSVGAVGVLTAASAVAQFSTRLMLGAAMRRWPDRYLVTAAALLLTLSNVSVGLSRSVVPFLLAELLQGIARACFWTGSQTHMVRRSASVRSLSVVNVSAAVGALIGPVLAGVLSESSPVLALRVAAFVAASALVPSLLLERFPPFARSTHQAPSPLWRRPGGSTGCWGSAVAGAWRGLLGSYVPVALQAAGQSAAVIGALAAVGNAAALLGSAAVGRLRSAPVRRTFLASLLATGAGTAAIAATAGMAPVAGTALALSGLGVGALTVLSPAVATEAVEADRRGDAIVTTGIFRAGALFATPMAMAGLAGVIALGPAMAIIGAVLALPVVTLRSLAVLPAAVPGPPDLSPEQAA